MSMVWGVSSRAKIHTKPHRHALPDDELHTSVLGFPSGRKRKGEGEGEAVLRMKWVCGRGVVWPNDVVKSTKERKSLW